MTLGLAGPPAPVSGEKQTVLRQVRCQFEPDGGIRFEATVCDRFTVDGGVIDANPRTVSATYPNEGAMIQLAANNWTPTPEQLEGMGGALSSGALGAVSVILQGFIGITLKAVEVLSDNQE